jgi:hypothetical protein
VYRRTEVFQPKSLRKENATIVLAGPEAGDQGCLQHFLGTPAEKTYFVDVKEKKGLTKAKRQFPGVTTYLGDVNDLVQKLPTKAALINLDFCGYLSKDREEIVTNAAMALADWGMVFYTFYRGRERTDYPFWKKVLQAPAKTLEGKRMVGTAQIMQDTLGPSFTLIFSLRYTGVTPLGPRKVCLGNMAILGFQRIPADFRPDAHWTRMLEDPPPFGGRVPSDKKLLDAHLRVEALSLRDRGLNSHEVGAVLNTSPGTVAAWFANQYRS